MFVELDFGDVIFDSCFCGLFCKVSCLIELWIRFVFGVLLFGIFVLGVGVGSLVFDVGFCCLWYI